MFTHMRTCAQQRRNKGTVKQRACIHIARGYICYACAGDRVKTPKVVLQSVSTGCQLGIGPQVSQSRALLATSSLQRRPLEPSMLIVYLGGACSPPEAGGLSMINCTGGCPSMAKRYRWFATSPGSVTGPDTTSFRGITKREPPPCSSVTGVTTPTRDTIAIASQVPHASVRNGAPTRHLAPLPRALVSHLPCQVWPTKHTQNNILTTHTT